MPKNVKQAGANEIIKGIGWIELISIAIALGISFCISFLFSSMVLKIGVVSIVTSGTFLLTMGTTKNDSMLLTLIAMYKYNTTQQTYY